MADPAHNSLLGYLGVGRWNTGLIKEIESLSGVESTFSQGFDFEYQYGTIADYKIDELKENGGTTFLKSQENMVRGVYYDAADYRTITVSSFFGAMKDGEGGNTKANLMAEYLAFFTNMQSPENLAVTNLGNVTWQAPGISEPTGYNIYLDEELLETVGSDLFEYTFTGLVFGQTYKVGISAVYGEDESKIVTVEFTYSLNSPQNLAVTELGYATWEAPVTEASAPDFT
ncbi:MAG: fibronectin type III domain-containing protein, partial [Candidatus Cloacimonetes bacterium]|nr:fibronectin type III domain-containing protein [Candidatus Cloacimonadota bacterium]